jgi:hypothetical protein
MTIETFEAAKAPEEKENGQGAALNLVDLSQKMDKCTQDVDVSQLAKVGPYTQILVNKDTFCEGAAHPSDSHNFITVDNRSLEPLSLTDIFKREDIYKAMMKDPAVQKALETEDAIYKNPKDYDELESDLYGKDGLGIMVWNAGNDKAGNEVSFRLGNEVLTNFAFHHVKDGMVGVRLLPDYAAEVTRNAMWQIGIYLPIPKGMEAAFKDAAAEKKGSFLMKDSDKHSKPFERHMEWERPSFQ